MAWIRDPRPGISWRAKRLRNKAKKKATRLRRRLPEQVGGHSGLDANARFRLKWSVYWYDRPLNDHLVLYESFDGNGALCNPRAIFDELLTTEDMTHLSHIWSFATVAIKREFDRQFASHPRVSSVLRGTTEYYRALSTAKYLVNNATFPANFTKREGQVYLNTWHGTPLKTMGYDSPGGPHEAKNTMRNFLAADYLLSPNDYMTTVMYERAYRLRGIYRGTIIQEGYPRIDTQFVTNDERNALCHELRSAGVHMSGSTVVLLAPTWRGRSFSETLDNAEELHAAAESLAEQLGPDYTVLVKVHQQVFHAATRHNELRNRLVPNSVETNRLLGSVDILVTDYSSIFFDFLASSRPILFYVPDTQSYERDRGVAIDLTELPGPTCTGIDELTVRIKAAGTGSERDPTVTHGASYRDAVKTYCPKEDGRATARVIDIVFRSRYTGYQLLRGLPDERTSILITAGRTRANGINTSLLSLLHNLDPAVYDVTVLLHQPRDERERGIQQRIPPSVRQVLRTGTFPVTARRLETHNRFLTTGLNSDGTYPGDEQRVLAAEWRHSFGMSTFDHAIEFPGYAPFWPGVLLQGDITTRSIWMHNDMLADSTREVGGKRVLEEMLNATFTLYRYFDNLVSVSPPLARINAESLAGYAPTERFTSARNTIDAERIRSLGVGADTAAATGTPDIRVADVPLSTAAARFVESYPLELVPDEIARQLELARLLPDRATTTTFVTTGRLSPEKNHARMIRAFARVHAWYPETRLLLIGDGPLMNDLEALVHRLNLRDAVCLAGHRSNPYTLMAASDCFVLSSDYEGQPMVILEALTLRLPVITVNFGSAASALPTGGGQLVPQSDEGLAAGMQEYLDNQPSAPEFDPEQYNAAALAEFRLAIGDPP